MRFSVLFLPLPLLLAACDAGVPESEQPEAEPAEPVGAMDEAAEPETQPAEAEQASIPPALRGRWGLIAADCEPGRADAKGLLVIDADSLEFYESMGTLDEVEQRGTDRLRARFDFIGEGMTWEREIELAAADDGATLIRREYGEDAAPEPFEYTSCG